MEKNEKQQLKSVLDEFESSLADIAGTGSFTGYKKRKVSGSTFEFKC